MAIFCSNVVHRMLNCRTNIGDLFKATANFKKITNICVYNIAAQDI